MSNPEIGIAGFEPSQAIRHAYDVARILIEITEQQDFTAGIIVMDKN